MLVTKDHVDYTTQQLVEVLAELSATDSPFRSPKERWTILPDGVTLRDVTRPGGRRLGTIYVGTDNGCPCRGEQDSEP